MRMNASRTKGWHPLLFALFFVPAYILASWLAFHHWLITAGMTFVALWWMPKRRWWIVILATIAGRHLNGMMGDWNGYGGEFLGHWPGATQWLLGNVFEPFLILPGVLLLKRWQIHLTSNLDAQRVVQLHLAALLPALLISLKDVVYVMVDGQVGDGRRQQVVNMVPLGGPDDFALLAEFAINHLMGAFVGIMLLTPLASWLANPIYRANSRRIVSAAAATLGPAGTIVIGAGLLAADSSLSENLRLFLMAAVILFAWHYGWRGAALAIAGVSIIVAIEDHLVISAVNPVWLQLFIAVSGAMGLMLGAALDESRSRTGQLEQARLRERKLAEDLRSAAQRNLDAEDRERRRLATELHDEFGQNLAALQTRLRLASPEMSEQGGQSRMEEMLGITRTMRRNISRVLAALRPAGLDELGLYAAIDRGAIRRELEAAGIQLELQLRGDARLLSALASLIESAAYRLVQEATTNIIRHARATSCLIRLRCDQRGGMRFLFIEIRDDGVGIAPGRTPGNGLQGMRDRVLAMAGALHVRSGSKGVRVHAMFLDQRAGLASGAG